MKDIAFMTSFSHPYYVRYGHKLLASFKEYVADPAVLTAYHEASVDGDHPKEYDDDPRIAMLDVHEVTPYPAFHKKNRIRVKQQIGNISPDPEVRRESPVYRYHLDALTFGKKAFAWIHAARACKERYLVWLDADIIFLKAFPASVITDMLKDVGIAYYARPWPHMESGFYVVDLTQPFVRDFIEEYATYWEKERIFNFPVTSDQSCGWTDCHSFDAAVKTLLPKGLKVRSLSIPPKDGSKRWGHVVAFSPLSEYLDHCKGPRKKKGRSYEMDMKKDPTGK